MTLLSLPDEKKEREPVFYLAMEEFVADNLDVLLRGKSSKEAFFLWQTAPSVIFGRNQVMEAEVNVKYCKEHGIRLFRRKSGGGCIYSDWGNIMHSCVSDSTEVSSVFDRYLSRFSAALCSCGVDAVPSGRNDIMVNGRKVSGNAFFLRSHSSIVHGTLLYDTDFGIMEKALSPSFAKIHSKGVSSVRQHVANLKPLFGQSSVVTDIAGFRRFLAESFCMSGSGMDEISLNEEQVAEIEKIEEGYLCPDFINGHNHRYSKCRQMHIRNVGNVTMEVDMDGNTILDCRVSGDYLFLKEGIDERLSSLLHGVSCDAEHTSAALKGIDIGEYVKGMDTDILVSLITG